jgi:hypothetical protein
MLGEVTQLISRSRPLARFRTTIKSDERRRFILSSSLESPSPSCARTARYYTIVTDRRRCVSVFSHFTTDRNRSEKYAHTEMNAKDNEWHFSTFMSASTIAEKEAWLENLLETTNGRTASNVTVTGNSFPVIDIQAFLVVLKALASAEAVTDAGAPRRADVWMNSLLKYHRNSLKVHPNAFRLLPTSECYQYVIQAWANSNKEQVMVIRNRSERWLNDLLEKSGDELLMSITVPGKNPTPMKEDTPNIEPTIECFNAFLDGLTRGRQGKNKRDRKILVDNAKLAESILRRLHSICAHRAKQQGDETNRPGTYAIVIRPNTETFNHAIRGWTRCKHERNIHKRVLALLRLMEGYQRKNPAAFISDPDAPRPNTKSYSMAMDALITEAKLKARHHCNYQRQIRKKHGNWKVGEDTSLNGIDEMNEAAAILEYMHDLRDAGVEGVIPHRVPYNILITGWAALASFNKHRYYYTPTNDNHGEEFKAEGILRTMMSHRDSGFVDASPDVISYERVILAWANSGHPNAGKRALWWLKQLWRDYNLHREFTSNASHESSLQPTVDTYNVVMKALSRTDGALAAENVLLDLGEKYRDSTNHPDLCPNSESFAIVIRAWLESAKEARNVDDRIASVRRAYEWLSSLRGIENENNLSTAPELFYGLLSVSKSCAKQRPHILDLAQQIFDDFRRSRHPLDCISYATLLKVGLQAHSGPDRGEMRVKFVEKLFVECCDDGLVSNVFVRTLVDDPSIECKRLVDRALRDWPLPSSWSRNLKNNNNRCAPNDLKPLSEREGKRGNNKRIPMSPNKRF